MWILELYHFWRYDVVKIGFLEFKSVLELKNGWWIRGQDITVYVLLLDQYFLWVVKGVYIIIRIPEIAPPMLTLLYIIEYILLLFGTIWPILCRHQSIRILVTLDKGILCHIWADSQASYLRLNKYTGISRVHNLVDCICALKHEKWVF